MCLSKSSAYIGTEFGLQPFAEMHTLFAVSRQVGRRHALLQLASSLHWRLGLLNRRRRFVRVPAHARGPAIVCSPITSAKLNNVEPFRQRQERPRAHDRWPPHQPSRRSPAVELGQSPSQAIKMCDGATLTGTVELSRPIGQSGNSNSGV
jgi:hypothetical protein